MAVISSSYARPAENTSPMANGRRAPSVRPAAAARGVGGGLEEDGWADRRGWQGGVARSVEAALAGRRAGGLVRVFTPDAREYRACDSAYAALRAQEL